MLTIIAGPCSVNKNNIEEIEEILNIEINGNKVISGIRCVGLKSRTIYTNNSIDMGIDLEVFKYNQQILISGKSYNEFEIMPSIELAKQLQDKYNCIIATEIIEPAIQMLLFDKYLTGSFIPWNPAVNALGWNIQHISKYCEKRDNWLLGIKNPKNLGISVEDAEVKNMIAPMEHVWSGLAGYSNLPNGRKVLIHRGVDAEKKSNFRSMLVHKTAMRVKNTVSGAKLLFDPSHSFGPKMRDEIVDGTVEIMKMKDLCGNFLYDGILIEVGTSTTDAGQHISVKELRELVNKLSEFRDIY